MFTFLFAGHETSLAALYWSLYYLGEHDEYRVKIAQEFEELGGKINQWTLKKGTYSFLFNLTGF